jgi:sensor histidine kinase regulating citrate/malate metabolism
VLFLALELALLKKKYRTLIVLSALLGLLEIAVLKGTPFDLLNVVRFEKTLGNSYKGILIFIAITSVILLILIIVFELWYHSYRNLERERAENKYLADINEKYNEMRTIKHDMNNHLAAILFLMDEGKNDEARRYIRELTGVTSKTANIRKTGMKALDLLLWNKVSQASAKKIDIEMQLDDEYREISISEYEMCSMFANIIDNAIEAVEKLKTLDRNTKETSGDEKKESRKIILRTSRQMEMMCVFCENPYAETKKENGNFVSTKKDAENHGLGLKQIRRIAEKHGGTMNIDDRDGVFRLSVIMNV